METKTVIIGKYEFSLFERENERSYPKHKFGVKLIQHTPKGKWSKFKTIENFVFKTFDEAEKYFNRKIESYTTNINTRIEKKKKDAEVNASDFYRVDDIICNSWGFEQTNVNFYRVVRVLNRSIEIVEIGGKVVEGSVYDHGMACEVIPNSDKIIDGGDKYLLRVYDNGRLSNPESFYYMHKWSGKPEYKSWYA